MAYGKVFSRHNRNVVRPKNRVTSAVDFIHRGCDHTVAMGIFEGEIDPNSGRFWKPRHVQLACRYHDLPFGVGNIVAIYIHARERIVRPQSLDLLELRLKGAPIPYAGVLQGRSV